jgi:hypothetical protein
VNTAIRSNNKILIQFNSCQRVHAGYNARSRLVDTTCLIRQCNGATTDCARARETSKQCYAQHAAKRKADYDAKQREYVRQHQAVVDAAKKNEDANNAVNPH